MTATLLSIMQDMCDELGLNRPSVVVGTTDVGIRQLYAFVKRATRELQQEYDWTTLQTEYNLHVSKPLQAFGDVFQGLYTVYNVKFSGSDFNDDFNNDFGTGVDALFFNPPSLWVVNGQFIPVATRLVSALDAATLTLDQPATGTQTHVPLTFSQDTYPGPADFDRFINQTWWDRTNRWALMGPDSPQIDQWHRSGVVTIGPRRHFRQIGSTGITPNTGDDFGISGPVKNYRIWPPPGATDTPLDLVYEYITKNIVVGADGIAKPTFTADTDFAIIDENAIILDSIWRWLKRKGTDYSQEQADAQDYARRNYGNDGGAKILSLSSRRSNFLLTSSQVQDGNFPSIPGVSGV